MRVLKERGRRVSLLLVQEFARVSEPRPLGQRLGQGSSSGETDDLLFLPSA